MGEIDDIIRGPQFPGCAYFELAEDIIVARAFQQPTESLVNTTKRCRYVNALRAICPLMAQIRPDLSVDVYPTDEGDPVPCPAQVAELGEMTDLLDELALNAGEDHDSVYPGAAEIAAFLKEQSPPEETTEPS